MFQLRDALITKIVNLRNASTKDTGRDMYSIYLLKTTRNPVEIKHQSHNNYGIENTGKLNGNNHQPEQEIFFFNLIFL